MKSKTNLLAILTFFVSLQSPVTLAFQVNKIHSNAFSGVDEIEMMELGDYPVKEAFERLKKKEFAVNESRLHKGVLAAFAHRKSEAIRLAIQMVKLRIDEHTEKNLVNRGRDFHVVKAVLLVFPDESFGRLLKLYDSTNDAVTRGNIIRIVGGMDKEREVRKLLLEALDNNSLYGGHDPEACGEPLRVCDVAYNVLVARYRFKSVLYTIGNGHPIEVRNYHINRLKTHL